MKTHILLLFLPLLLAGCQPPDYSIIHTNYQQWNYADLLVLDPIDTSEPRQDTIALYTRIIEHSFQLRIDFLDLSWPSIQDIYVPIDTNSGGLNNYISKFGEIPLNLLWDYMIIIPAVGDINVIDKNYLPLQGMELLVSRDNHKDYVTISFNQKALPIEWNFAKLQVLITSKNKNSVIDEINPVAIDSPPPPKANVLFLFWNTFSSNTPAQTLRSWDGAHSGPGRSRHGLKYLIEASEKTDTPVFISDLLNPESLSALDYIQVLPWITTLAQRKLINLVNIDSTQHLPPSLIFSPSELPNSESYMSNEFDFRYYGYSKYFNNIIEEVLLDNDYAHYNEIQNQCPFSTVYEAYDGNATSSSIKCKSLLVETALSGSPNPFILGGDFATSLLGDPSISKMFFEFVQSQPWIQVLTAADLHIFSPNLHSTIFRQTYISSYSSKETNIITSTMPSRIFSDIYNDILKSPKNHLTGFANHIFLSMLNSNTPSSLALVSNYVGQIDQVLEAAKWAESPTVINDCEMDIDRDSEKECILANTNLFLIIEKNGGYIPFAFYIEAVEPHQIIGPSWESILGISDPSTWEPSMGVRSDPGQLLGALEDPLPSWNSYNAINQANYVELFSNDMIMRKTISISERNIRIMIQNTDGENSLMSVPIALDPWIRFTPTWRERYYMIPVPDGFIWGIKDDISVEIKSTPNISIHSFNESQSEMTNPENPNYEYSTGYYLPYPFALVEIHSSENYSIDIHISSK